MFDIMHLPRNPLPKSSGASGMTRKREVMSMGKPQHKPGEDNRKPGEYVERGPRGGAVPNARQVTIGHGDRLPPTQAKGRKWERL